MKQASSRSRRGGFANIVMVAMGMAVVGCTAVRSEPVTKEIIEVAHPEELRFDESTGEERLVLRRGDRERVVSNLRSWGETVGGRYYFFGDEGSPSALLAVEREDGGGFHVYDYHEDYSLFSSEYGVVADVQPHQRYVSTFQLSVIRARSAEALRTRQVELGKDPRDPERKAMNYAEASVALLEHYRDGPYFEFLFGQAAYTIIRSDYGLDSGRLWSSGVGRSDHQDTSRTGARVETSAGRFVLVDRSGSRTLPTVAADGVPVTAVFGDDGSSAMVVARSSELERTDTYAIVLFDPEGRERARYELSDLFIYQDPIRAIESARWADEELVVIIDTSEFNYDLIIDTATGTAAAYLRSSEYDRFLK